MAHESHEERTIAQYSEACAVLADPGALVPEVGAPSPAGLGWLRAHVARFSNGADHDRRRALAEADLARIDAGRLQDAAHARTLAELRQAARPVEPADVAARVARTVPVATLAAALGIAEEQLDAVAEEVAAIAPVYLAGADAKAELGRRADHAVERLRRLVGPGEPEEVANRIGLLVQACGATAGLVLGAFERALEVPAQRWPLSAIVAETLRHDPPVRSTRRLLAGDAGAEATLLIDLAAANRDPAAFVEPDRFDPGRPGPRHLTFGQGLRPCPGAEHAVALACGVVSALLAATAESNRCS